MRGDIINVHTLQRTRSKNDAFKMIFQFFFVIFIQFIFHRLGRGSHGGFPCGACTVLGDISTNETKNS